MTRSRRRSWTLEQKQSLVAEVVDRTNGGEPFSRVARDLGIHDSTLRQWATKFAEGGVQPVKILDVVPTERGPSSASSISLAVPGGFVFAGLDVAGAIRIWERLR